MKCSVCGFENPDHAHFCAACGAPLQCERGEPARLKTKQPSKARRIAIVALIILLCALLAYLSWLLASRVPARARQSSSRQDAGLGIRIREERAFQLKTDG